MKQLIFDHRKLAERKVPKIKPDEPYRIEKYIHAITSGTSNTQSTTVTNPQTFTIPESPAFTNLQSSTVTNINPTLISSNIPQMPVTPQTPISRKSAYDTGYPIQFDRYQPITPLSCRSTTTNKQLPKIAESMECDEPEVFEDLSNYAPPVDPPSLNLIQTKEQIEKKIKDQFPYQFIFGYKLYPPHFTTGELCYAFSNPNLEIQSFHFHQGWRNFTITLHQKNFENFMNGVCIFIMSFSIHMSVILRQVNFLNFVKILKEK